MEEAAQSVDVLPYVGFGAVRLGMTKDQVREQLGEPDRADAEPDGDATLVYERDGVQCAFCAADGGVLGSITFESGSFVVGGNRVVGISTESLLELGRQGVLPGLCLDQDWPELRSSSYDCESLGLSFWVHENRVESMTLYQRYDDSGEHLIFPSLE